MSQTNKLQKLSPEVNRILMIKNLPYNITPDEMYEIFGKFGSIRQIRVGVEKEVKGTAFVIYDDVLCAKKALEALQGFNVAGRYIVVLYYQPKKMMQRQQKEKEIAELKKWNEELAKKIEKK